MVRHGDMEGSLFGWSERDEEKICQEREEGDYDGRQAVSTVKEEEGTNDKDEGALRVLRSFCLTFKGN